MQMDARARLPLVFFMAIEAIADVMRQLSKDGMPPETPVAVVFGAGSQDEITVRGTLGDIAGKIHDTGQPGIVVVGAPASRAYRDLRSPLSGTRVLLACTKTLSGKAGLAVRDLGGTPVFQRLLETVARPDAARIIRRINAYDYVVVTSPTSARILLEILDNCGLDLRALPRIIVTGTGTARVFRANGIRPDIIPVNDPGSRGVLDAAAAKVHHGARILRLRSDAAGSRIADELAAIGFNVTDCVIYENRIVTGNRPLPAFDAVFFASASAVEAFMVVAGREHLAGKLIAPMGQPTAEALNRHSIAVERLPGETTLESAMLLLAAMNIEKRLEEIPQ